RSLRAGRPDPNPAPGGLAPGKGTMQRSINRGKAMNKLSMSGNLSRRTFLQVSAAGVVTASSLGTLGRAVAEPYSKFTWISPRGTLEVLDDYPYWIGKKMG